MSEQEFENWLALLSGLLKLSPEQRNNISDELRSHLEDRMEDLIDAGSSREEAIAAALEDFGDTAALAHHFTTIAHQQRRRLMRYTYGTIAAVTCAILVLVTFWPEPQGPVMPNVSAQSQLAQTNPFTDSGTDAAQSPAPAGEPEYAAPYDFAEERAKIEIKLSVPMPEIEYFQMPLGEVINDLSKQLEVAIFIDPSLVGDLLDINAPVDIEAPANTMSARTLLNDFILKPLCGDQVGYTIRDNYVMITNIHNSTEVAVYNCRNLLAPPSGSGSMAMGGAAGMEGAMGEEMMMGSMEGMYGDNEAGSMGARMLPPSVSDQHLMRVIVNTVAPDTWIVAGKPVTEHGGTGSIDAINGIIVIKHTREVHEQVKQLLQLLGQARNQPTGGGQGFF